MSRENVELVRRNYARLKETYRVGELDPRDLEEMWHPDCVLKPAGVLPETREMRGRNGVAQIVMAPLEAFEQMKVEPAEFIDAGDRVVVPFRFGGRGRHTGIEVDFDVVHVWTVKDGKVARLDMYATKDEAFEAAGLRTSP